MSSPRKTLLVTGATGRQGGALIATLLAMPDAGGFDIVAVTRDPASRRAQSLAAHVHVVVLAGSAADPAAVFAQIPAAVAPVWGVFGVQVNADAEEAQGKALVDAAVAHGVRHFVYASGDRGGPERSPHNPTRVQNFAAKYHVEQHLQAAAAAAPSKRPLTYTILRPVTFFENLTADMHGRGFARMWAQVGDKPLQLVATRDIGWFAAQAFVRPDDAAYANAALTLAGDELTQPQAAVLFQAAVGLSMPLAPCPVASAVKFFRGEVGDMFRWFADEGYGGDVAVCRLMHPEMLDFAGWMAQNKGRWE